eukprot:CAMPEP_0206425722 /NCGR_PEP_ID=MMETSP0324_2-20121206/3956_1 /ASSEMBLY_ACC=CAM_ASM_000836 /TAXON_ID=2866 /ORGANISM="Crypthecodinium cohnii, Strain Seligo" /LENGTH=30 /DNA_ID= /DNA_START= /DNA_END= /DNA_ORIENTATION=
MWHTTPPPSTHILSAAACGPLALALALAGV